MSKFKKGDRVKCIDRDYAETFGKIGVVTDVKHDGNLYRVWAEGRDLHYHPQEIELAKEESAAPKFKAGDRVNIARKIKWEGWVPSMDAYVGRVETINSVYEEDGDVRAFIDGWFFPVEALEPIEMPTASEPFKFRVGDRGKTRHGLDYEVIRIDGTDTYLGNPQPIIARVDGIERDYTVDGFFFEKSDHSVWDLMPADRAEESKVEPEVVDAEFEAPEFVEVQVVDAQAYLIASLSTAYRQAGEAHTEALARCAAARQQYADAEDEMNSASDRLEAAGKALLEAVAKQ
jgi:hypothetical protein